MNVLILTQSDVDALSTLNDSFEPERTPISWNTDDGSPTGWKVEGYKRLSPRPLNETEFYLSSDLLQDMEEDDGTWRYFRSFLQSLEVRDVELPTDQTSI